MQGKNVKAGTTFVALYGQRSGGVLHRKVISHRTRPIANKVVRWREPFFRKEFAEEIIESALSERELIRGRYRFASDQRKRTLRTGGGRRSEGSVLSPAARSYIFTARL